MLVGIGWYFSVELYEFYVNFWQKERARSPLGSLKGGVGLEKRIRGGLVFPNDSTKYLTSTTFPFYFILLFLFFSNKSKIFCALLLLLACVEPPTTTIQPPSIFRFDQKCLSQVD